MWRGMRTRNNTIAQNVNFLVINMRRDRKAGRKEGRKKGRNKKERKKERKKDFDTFQPVSCIHVGSFLMFTVVRFERLISSSVALSRARNTGCVSVRSLVGLQGRQ